MTLLVNDGKRLTEPIGVAFVEPKAKKLIYKLTPARPLLNDGKRLTEPIGVAFVEPKAIEAYL